ncbi:MAG: MFS transporter [Chloroflexota bacterium]
MVSGIFQVIQVAVATQLFIYGKGGSTGLGWLYAVAGLGTAFGPLWTRKFTGDNDVALRWAILISYLLSIAGVAISAPLWSFGWLLFGTFVRTYGEGINWVFSSQLLYQHTPAGFRGRVFSVEFAIFTLAQALSAGLGGFLLENMPFNLSSLMMGIAVSAAFPMCLWIFWLVKKPRQGSREGG